MYAMPGPRRPDPAYLLDLLHEHNGQTLGELCDPAGQHLSILEAANLI